GGPISGAWFDRVAGASGPVRGVVRALDTGKPLAGVSVGQVEYWGHPRCQTVTDKEGRYELLGLAKWNWYSLVVKPADGLYFQRRGGLAGTPGPGAPAGGTAAGGGGGGRGAGAGQGAGQPGAPARGEDHPLPRTPTATSR